MPITGLDDHQRLHQRPELRETFLAQSAMQPWYEVGNVTFVETLGSTNIIFSNSGSMTAATCANWTYPGAMTSATVDIGSDWIPNEGGAMDARSASTATATRPSSTRSATRSVSATRVPMAAAHYLTDAIFANDTWQCSIMSYFGQHVLLLVTPQLADVRAVDHVYGVHLRRQHLRLSQQRAIDLRSFAIRSGPGADDL